MGVGSFSIVQTSIKFFETMLLNKYILYDLMCIIRIIYSVDK